MAPLSVARWTAFELLRRPATWVVLGGLALAWPAVASFAPLGVTTRDAPLGIHLYEIAFIGILFGASMGTDVLARSSWFLERSDPGRRLAAEAGGLVGATVAPLLAATVPALFVAPSAARALSVEHLSAVGLTVFHAAALGLLVLRIPSPPAARALALPLCAWIVPAIATVPPGDDPHVLRATLCNLLDASRHGAYELDEVRAWTQRGAALLPMMALAVAAWRLAARAPSVHALRNPR